MKKLISLLLLVIIVIPMYAVFDGRFADASSASLGDMPAELGLDGASLFGENGLSAGFGYRMNLGHSDFNEPGFYAAWGKDKVGRFMLTFSDFSVNDLTTETEIGISATRDIIVDPHNVLKFAVRGDVYSLSYGKSQSGVDLGSATALGLTFAMEATIYERTRVAILGKNLTGTTMGTIGDIELPRTVAGLIGYSPYTNTELTAFARREAGHDFEYSVGAFARPIEYLSFKAGIITNPNRFTGGLGIHYKWLAVHYAILTHPVLPLSHVVSLNFQMDM